MKNTTLLAALIFSLLFGCKEKNSHRETQEGENTETTHAHTSSIEEGDWKEKIQLDTNDKKWKANPETNEGIAKMLESIEKSNPKTTEEYHKLGEELNSTKNYILEKCTMIGASHENLHIFLHPVIEKIAALEGVSTPEEGKRITHDIERHLQAYYDYFD
ncbi:MAG TPA: hypothetical protein VK010_05445 [Flavobacteriaceae bacterium]|nr:hypothetical protein [Flavobacteriaceae bacterium]